MAGKVYDFSITSQIPVPTVKNFKLISIDRENSLVFLERVFGDENYVHFTRFSAEGQIKSQGSIIHPSVDDHIKHSMFTAPANTFGFIEIWSYIKTRGSNQNKMSVLGVYYSANKDRIGLKEHLVNDIEAWLPLRGDIFWWQDVAYLEYAKDGKMRVINFQTEASKKAERKWEIAERPFILGDETFLICVGTRGYGVWCFNKNVPLADRRQTTLCFSCWKDPRD